MNNSIQKRLTSLMGELGKNEFARKCDIRPSTMLGYLNGSSPPSIENLKKIAKASGVTVGWLAAGEYPKEADLLATLEEADSYKHRERKLRSMAFTEPEGKPVCPECSSDFAGHIVQVHSAVGYESSQGDWEPEPIFRVCIPQRFHFPNLLVIKVEGDSMEPDIKEGSLVGIDTSQKDITGGKTYSIQVPYEGLALRKVFIDPESSKLLLKSNNPDHPDQKLPLDKREELMVGKAIWVMQEI